jgi:beta-glucosidase
VDQAEVTIWSQVENKGIRHGKQVVHIYVALPPCDGNPRPVKELKAYRKVFVPAGEAKEVIFKLDKYAFNYFIIAERHWTIRHGEFSLYLVFS